MKKNIAEDVWTFADIIKRQYPAISHEAIDAMSHHTRCWECKKGAAIVTPNDGCYKWIFVSRGLHRVTFTKNHKEDTLFFDGGGAIFTSFHSICADKECIFGLEALTDSYGWEMSHKDFTRLQEQYTDILKFEIGFLRHQLYSLEDYYRRRALSTPQERYEQFWGKRQEKLKYLAPHILSRFIPLKVIAQYLSMTPQMLSILRRRELENNRMK